MQKELWCPQAGYTRAHVLLSLIFSSCLAIFYTYIFFTLSIGYFISLNQFYFYFLKLKLVYNVNFCYTAK